MLFTIQDSYILSFVSFEKKWKKKEDTNTIISQKKEKSVKPMHTSTEKGEEGEKKGVIREQSVPSRDPSLK